MGAPIWRRPDPQRSSPLWRGDRRWRDGILNFSIARQCEKQRKQDENRQDENEFHGKPPASTSRYASRLIGIAAAFIARLSHSSEKSEATL